MSPSNGNVNGNIWIRSPTRSLRPMWFFRWAAGLASRPLSNTFPKPGWFPASTPVFLGLPTEQGVWAERCAACGDCILGLTGGICPIARCSKSLLNGPCGGSEAGHCEINPDVDCAWQLIYDRLISMDKLHVLMDLQPPKNWTQIT